MAIFGDLRVLLFVVRATCGKILRENALPRGKNQLSERTG